MNNVKNVFSIKDLEKSDVLVETSDADAIRKS